MGLKTVVDWVGQDEMVRGSPAWQFVERDSLSACEVFRAGDGHEFCPVVGILSGSIRMSRTIQDIVERGLLVDNVCTMDENTVFEQHSLAVDQHLNSLCLWKYISKAENQGNSMCGYQDIPRTCARHDVA